MNESLSVFLLIAFNFPTLIFTILLMISVLYWLVAMLGFFDVEMADVDGSAALDAEGVLDLSGLLATLGLHGVPLPLSITLLSLFSWLASYSLELLAIKLGVPGLLRSWIGVGVLVVSIVAGYLLAVAVAGWLRPLFSRLHQLPKEFCLVELTGVVTGIAKDRHRGRARVSRNGVDLTVNIKAEVPLEHGMKVLLSRDEGEHFFWAEVVVEVSTF